MFRISLSVVLAATLLRFTGAATSCISIDANFNLLAFNLNGKDFNAGTSDQWASGSATQLTSNGRPPFTGTAMTCHFSQFSNAVYVLDADSSNPNDIYIYDAQGNSWSNQKVTAPDGFDPTSLGVILDHDTNIFYGISKGQTWSLAMGDTLSVATSDAKSWQQVDTPPFDASSYKPVMGLAQNHIHLLNVPNVAPGSAQIFVIHFSYWQPEIQQYGDFPAEHGQAASIFLSEGAQQEFAFIPDSGSNTYVVNVNSNSTKTLAGPTTKDAGATYFGTPNSIVQLTSNGAVNYIPYSTDPSSASGSWTSVKALAQAAPPSSGSSSSSGSKATSTGSSGSKVTGAAASASASASSAANANGAPESISFQGVLTLMVVAILSSVSALVI